MEGVGRTEVSQTKAVLRCTGSCRCHRTEDGGGPCGLEHAVENGVADDGQCVRFLHALERLGDIERTPVGGVVMVFARGGPVLLRGSRPRRSSAGARPGAIQQLASQAPGRRLGLLVVFEMVARQAGPLIARRRRRRIFRGRLAVDSRTVPRLEADRHPDRRQAVAGRRRPVRAARGRRCLNRTGVEARAARVIRTLVAESAPVGAALARARRSVDMAASWQAAGS